MLLQDVADFTLKQQSCENYGDKEVSDVNQQNELLKLIVLIQLFLSSTCFENLMFIIRKTILHVQSYMLLLHD